MNISIDLYTQILRGKLSYGHRNADIDLEINMKGPTLIVVNMVDMNCLNRDQYGKHELFDDCDHYGRYESSLTAINMSSTNYPKPRSI